MISPVISIFNDREIQYALKTKNKFFIIHLKNYSKLGQVSLKSAINQIDFFKQNKSVALQIDIPIYDGFFSIEQELGILLNKSDAIRIEDLGLARFINRRYSNLDIHLILNQHSKTVFAWIKLVELLSPNIKGLVLSPEIPFSDLKQQIPLIKSKYPFIKIEILVAGKILLYYSKRNFSIEDDNYYMIQSDKKDIPPLILNKINQNTNISFGKDLFIADLKKINELSLDYIRFDFKIEDHWKLWNIYYNNQELLFKNLKKNWKRRITRGFFNTNKTDRPFRLLKNKHMNSSNKTVGSIIEYVPNSHCLIKIIKNVKLPILINIKTPEGVEVNYHLKSAKSLIEKTSLEYLKEGNYYIIDPIRKAVKKSQLSIVKLIKYNINSIKFFTNYFI